MLKLKREERRNIRKRVALIAHICIIVYSSIVKFDEKHMLRFPFGSYYARIRLHALGILTLLL